jgi:putative protease
MTQPVKKRMPELLAPAGGPEQLSAALRYGADAVYGGLPAYGLRAAAANFTPETLPAAVAETHRQGGRFYVTLHLLPFDRDMEGFAWAPSVGEAGRDALIVSDLGAALQVREAFRGWKCTSAPRLTLLKRPNGRHYYEAIGAKRIVLSREMSLYVHPTMRARLPGELELEAFVHGAIAGRQRPLPLTRRSPAAAATGANAPSPAAALPRAGIEAPRPMVPVPAGSGATGLFSAYDLSRPHLPALLPRGFSV